MRSFETIRSRDNQRLKFVRQVRDGRESAFIFIEGRRLAYEALRSDIMIRECYSVDGTATAQMLDESSISTADIYEISERLFDSIADTKQSQGIILIGERPSTDMRSAIAANLQAARVPIVVFLHEVNNPSNLGAVVRTAEAAGIAGVITSQRSADAYSPKALRASMGSAFRMPIWVNAPIEKVSELSRELSLITTASDTAAASDHTKIDWRVPRLLICGSEAHGLENIDTGKIQEMVRIPMEPQVESLNLAVSAGVILFEARRQIDAGRQ